MAVGGRRNGDRLVTVLFRAGEQTPFSLGGVAAELHDAGVLLIVATSLYYERRLHLREHGRHEGGRIFSADVCFLWIRAQQLQTDEVCTMDINARTRPRNGILDNVADFIDDDVGVVVANVIDHLHSDRRPRNLALERQKRKSRLST